jgi:hypothetical protein
MTTSIMEILREEDAQVIPVVVDERNFYRCIAVLGSVELQNGKQSSSTSGEECDLRKLEASLAAGIKREVVSQLKRVSEDVELQQLCCQLSTSLSRRAHVTDSLQQRIDAIDRSHGYIDVLEVMAVSYLAKMQVHLFQRCDAGYKVFTKYPTLAYSSRPPIRLLYNPGDQSSGVRESFEVLQQKNESFVLQWTRDEGRSLFHDCALTAKAVDEDSSFKQLIVDELLPQSNEKENLTTGSK